MYFPKLPETLRVADSDAQFEKAYSYDIIRAGSAVKNLAFAPPIQSMSAYARARHGKPSSLCYRGSPH